MSWGATALASGVSLGAVLTAFCLATDGYTLLTAEEARRRSVAREQPALPPLPVQAVGAGTQKARDWAELLQADGRVAVMHFVYTGCRTLCSVQSAQTRALQREIEQQGLSKRVHLVTVSFDPERDTLTVLEEYAGRFGAERALWSMWRPEAGLSLQSALLRLGIVVIPDPELPGEFIHNAAWLVVDSQARLRAIVPQEAPSRALRLAQELAS